MKSILVTLFISFFIHSASAKTKVLLIEGLSNHNWEQRSKLLKARLTEDPAISVTVSITPSTANLEEWKQWRPQFNDYDVVISAYNDIGVKGGLRWPTEVEKSFEQFVANGGGFYAFHEANNAFPDWTEYNKMIGLGWRNKGDGKAIVIAEDESLQFVPSGEGSNTGHGKRLNVEVTRLADSHPIYLGLPDSWMAADLEVYRYARGPAVNISVLTYAKDPKTQLQFPVEWSTNYGKGRVYVSTYGHIWHGDTEPAGFRCDAFLTILPRAIKWLAKEDLTPEKPHSFPASDVISLRKRLKLEKLD